MRSSVGVLALCLIVFGCGEAEEPAPSTTTATSRAPSGPSDIVAQWIDGVIASDADALGDLVEPEGLIVLAAIENGYSEAEMIGLLDAGVPAELVGEYWASFRSGFAEVAGISLQAISVGENTEFTMGEIEFAVVVVTSGDATTEVITSRRTGVWRLDLVASFGAAFAAQLRRVVVGLSDGPEGERIRRAYREAIVPSLLATFRMQPGNRILAAELERITLTLES